MRNIYQKLENLLLSLFFWFINNRNFVKNVCIVAFVSPNPEIADTYFIAILGGECDQYTFTSEYLAELSKHLVRMEDLDWSILAEDSTMDYKVVEARKWKDTHIFYIIDEGKWENWLEEVKENHKKK